AVSRVRELEKELEKLRAANVLEQSGELAAKAEDEFGVAFVGHRAPDGTSADDLRKLALDIRSRIAADQPSVVATAAATDGRPVFASASTSARCGSASLPAMSRARWPRRSRCCGAVAILPSWTSLRRLSASGRRSR